jgi:hypothetical protein
MMSWKRLSDWSRPMRKLPRSAILAICSFVLLIGLVPSAYGTDKKEIVSQARQSYYNLTNAGLNGFRCQVQPDFDATFKALKASPIVQDQVLPILRKTHFELLVGPNGASTVSHQSELPPPNEDVAGRVRNATAGVEQILTGFMETWSQFMINSTPLPDANGDYQLENLGNKYRITAKQGSADAVILMDLDYEITELKATTSELSGTIWPKFIRIKNQLILASYVYSAQSGDPQELSVEIEYGDIEGLKLPAKVTATMKLPSGAVDFLLTFAGCQVDKR